MVNSVSSVNSPTKTTKTSIFYVNDEHGNIDNMARLKNAAVEFDSFSAEGVDKLKFSAGDFGLGQNAKLNKLAVTAQNSIGIMASAGGNHEFDLKKADLIDVLKDNNYKMLGINVDIPQTTQENKELRKEITNSYIQEQNGTKYGVIGVMPFDFIYHVTDAKEYKDFNIIPLEKTVPLIQKKIDAMKEQGVNKIILLSHAGYDDDVKLAKAVEGIDVIVGGHSHDLIKGIKEGKNLFYSKKTGEPTIITQAGKDGRYFGVLNLEFDENGVIKTAQNNINKTNNYSKSSIMQYFTDTFFGKPQVIGVINSAEKAKSTIKEENPTADFVCDAVRSELDTDIIIMNAENIREDLRKGKLTDRAITELTPFKNKVCIIKLSEKELVDALKLGAKSTTIDDGRPGLLQCSGLKYTVTKSGELKKLSIVNKDGTETPVDIDNPNPFKMYRTASDSFLAKGGNDFMPKTKYAEAEAKFEFDKDKFVIDYVKKLNKPIEIKADGRIKIED